MKTEPLVDRDSIHAIFAHSKRNRIAYLRGGSAKAAGAVRWGGLAALFAFGLTLFGGHNAQAGDTTSGDGGTHTTSVH